MNWKKIIVLAVVVIVFAMSAAFTFLTFTKTDLTVNNFLPIEIIYNLTELNADTMTVTELDTIVFTTDTLIWRTTIYKATTGWVVLSNVDDTDTLLFAPQATPTKWTRIYPDGGSWTFMPAFMETLYVKPIGSNSVDLEYVFTLPRIVNK